MKIFHITKKIKLQVLLIILITVTAGFKIFDDGDDFEIAKKLDLFHDVVREVRLYYVDRVNMPELINEATKELLKKLDPYTVFYSESEIEDFTLMTTGSYGGIGAVIIKRENFLLISDIKQGSPADSSGLKIGDKITAVNDIEINKNNISEIIKNLKGEPGSKISLEILRNNKKIQKTITREKINPEVVSYAGILENNTGYIKLDEFTSGSSAVFRKKLNELNKSQKLNALIIDLRDNPGGLLNEAVETVNLFVPKGSEIVSTKGKVKSWNQTYTARNKPLFPDLPLAVIINNKSASASEIVAGALQDLDRAVITGQKSYGKGLVQVTRKLEYNTRIKITTAKYYIPSGRCIQAVDYSHGNKNKQKIPDSLISEFKTKNGRPVFDGGGIDPDIYVKPDTLNDFVSDLIKNFEIFDFCTDFYYKNKKTGSPENFSLSDGDFKKLVDFVLSSEYEYKTKTEKTIQNLYETAEKENYDEKELKKIKNLQISLSADKEKLMYRFKNEIKDITEKEIIKRYYYEKGIIKRQTVKDEEIKKAVEILKNKTKYQKILSGINE